MRKSLVFILMSIFLLPTVSSIAFAEKRTFPEWDACLESNDKNGDYSDYSMRMCAAEEHTRQKARMDIAYNKLLQQIANDEYDENSNKLKALVKSQQAWVTYTEEYSDFITIGDGTLGMHVSIIWLVHATAERADDLEIELIDTETTETGAD